MIDSSTSQSTLYRLTDVLCSENRSRRRRRHGGHLYLGREVMTYLCVFTGELRSDRENPHTDR